MYSVVYVLFFALRRAEKRRRESGKRKSKIITFLTGYCEWFYNIPFRRWCEKQPSKKYGLNQSERRQKIIVSLTSYPKRINIVWMTIETLLRQSYRPDAIILWLAESQFEGMKSLPDNLLRLCDRGLTIRFCDDLRSHKKYYYVMQEYPKDLVILVDDDIFYPYDTIQRLMKMHKKRPEDICTMTAQIIGPSYCSPPSKWRNPGLQEKVEHSDHAQIYTGSGSLYPPQSLDKRVFDKELIKRLCLNADDLWITFMAHKKGTKVTAEYKWRAFPVNVYGTFEGSLWHLNAGEGQNDMQWKAVTDYFDRFRKAEEDS